ncbi:MAG: hypothetical protein IKO11_02650 [Lachnospiraceae bacterium]|nr:hypothetical protein [Lachnospiraceae bacterium]
MSVFDIKIQKTIDSSLQIAGISERLKSIQEELGNMRLSGIMDGGYADRIESRIRTLYKSVMDEAVKMHSMSAALETIASKYRDVEKRISNAVTATGNEAAAAVRDKRNWWQKFWDWITGKKADDYDITSDEQEKAADEAMKRQLWEVLQDEKYSQENWDRASIEERKQILQDYMYEVMKIYGLKDVKPTIVWDPNATYEDDGVTMGYYSPDRHTVTLNENVLSDGISWCDSYDLLATVSHELRHAYQHEAVDHPTRFMVSQDTIDAWADNFKPGHYIDPDVDYDGYLDQPVERDARDFEISRDSY